MYNEFKTIPSDSDECFSKGICSVNPTVSSIHEIMLLYLKELAFYLLKLKSFGVTNEAIKDTVIDILFNIIANADFNQEQFHDIIKELDSEIAQSKMLYEKVCIDKNIDIDSVKTYFKHSKNFTLSDAIKKGEKYFLKKTNTFTALQKDLFDITLFLVKSMGIKMIEAKRLGKDHDDGYYAMLSMLNEMNFSVNEFSEEAIKAEIERVLDIYYDLLRFVFKTQVELYGEMEAVEVSATPELGKAILVSGSDFKKLEMVLKATENTEINVYTHGLEMLMAHSFPKLRSYPNLKGHFGLGMDTSLIDFATFPGAILMTKATLQKLEYLYRGMLFTLDPIPPQGVVRIKDYNFEPLIKSALNSKGFTHIQPKPPIKVGYSISAVKKEIDKVAEKIINKEIRHLYIMGLINYPDSSNLQYFEKFFSLLPPDCFAISMSYKKQASNVFHVDSFCDYSLIYNIIKDLREKLAIDQIPLSIFLTKCDKHTISNLLYLKHIGVKDLYMCKCAPSLVNPVLIKTLQEVFEIKEFSDARTDIESSLGSQI